MEYSISFLVIVSMVIVEGYRIRAGQKINFLSAFNALFLLNFAIPPLLFSYFAPRLAAIDPDGKLWIYPLMSGMGMDEFDFVSASVWSLIAYIVITATYFALKKPANLLRVPDAGTIPNFWLMAVMTGCAVIAIAAAYVYVDSLGGIENATRYNALLRSDAALNKKGIVTRNYTFLIYFALFIIPAFIFAISQVTKVRSHLAPLVLAMIFWVMSLLVLVQRAGRLDIVLFILLLPLALYFRFAFKTRHIVGSMLIIIAIVYVLATVGNVMFFKGVDVAIIRLFSTSPDVSLFVGIVLQEFAFPYMVLAHIITLVPDAIEYRYFYDFVLAVQYMVPNMGATDQLAPTANMINGKLFGVPVPMDLLSHGFVYLGGAGLVIVSFVFGAALRGADSLFDPDKGWLFCLFRAWWMLYLPFRLMYGDPYNSIKSGFELFAGTAVFAVIVIATHIRNQRNDQSPVS